MGARAPRAVPFSLFLVFLGVLSFLYFHSPQQGLDIRWQRPTFYRGMNDTHLGDSGVMGLCAPGSISLGPAHLLDGPTGRPLLLVRRSANGCCVAVSIISWRHGRLLTDLKEPGVPA